MASSKIPLATKVGDAVGTADITAMWQAHFSDLLNSVHDTSSKSFVCEHVDAVLPGYSITLDVNFNASKSFYVFFNPKLFKLRFPELNINEALIPFTNSIKYLGFTFTNSHKDDNDMLL